MSRSLWVVTRDDDPGEPEAFDDPVLADAYEGALRVAEVSFNSTEIKVNDREETAERIRETIAHLADKDARRG